MVDIWSQFRAEWVHLASVALEYGAIGLVTILWFYYRRYLRHCDANEAKRDLQIEVYKQELDDHKHRSGLEIQDIHYRMGIMAAQVRQKVPEVEIPEWPSR